MDIPEQDLQQDIKQTDKGYMEKKTEEPIATSWFENELFVYLLVTSQDITPDRIFAEYHRILLRSDKLSKCIFSASKILVRNNKETTRNKGQVKG